MSQINRPPLGLQGLLGSKNFGVNPDDLVQTVQPTLDMIPFFGSGALKQYNISGSLAGPGQVVATGDHEGLAWYVLGMSFARFGTFPAATSPIQCCFTLNEVNTVTAAIANQTIAASPLQAIAAADHYAFAYAPPQPILLEPFVRIGARWLASPGAFSMTLSVLYYEVEI